LRFGKPVGLDLGGRARVGGDAVSGRIAGLRIRAVSVGIARMAWIRRGARGRALARSSALLHFARDALAVLLTGLAAHGTRGRLLASIDLGGVAIHLQVRTARRIAAQ